MCASSLWWRRIPRERRILESGKGIWGPWCELRPRHGLQGAKLKGKIPGSQILSFGLDQLEPSGPVPSPFLLWDFLSPVTQPWDFPTVHHQPLSPPSDPPHHCSLGTPSHHLVSEVFLSASRLSALPNLHCDLFPARGDSGVSHRMFRRERSIPLQGSAAALCNNLSVLQMPTRNLTLFGVVHGPTAQVLSAAPDGAPLAQRQLHVSERAGVSPPLITQVSCGVASSVAELSPLPALSNLKE